NASKGRCVTVTRRGNRLADLRLSTAQWKLQLAQRESGVALTRGGLLFARFRQANVDGRAAAADTRKRNFSAMRFHHRSGNGEAKTGATRLSVRHEWFEKPRQYLGRDANAGIGNAQHHLILHEIGSDRENSTADHGFARVFYQTRKHANETGAIDLDIAVESDLFDEVDVLARKQTQRLLIELIKHSPDGNELFVQL